MTSSDTVSSSTLYEQAQKMMPGGVNSPVRAFNGVGGIPKFIDSANGPFLYDTEGKQYIDYVLSWGPMIHGHNHTDIRNAVIQAAEKGLSFGAPTKIEMELAEIIINMFPSIEQLRMLSSGTEATMTAIRLARGYTNKQKIIKFEGCYHGHADSLLVKAGSGSLTLGVPSSPGIPHDFAKHTLTATFNDLNSVEILMQEYAEDVAAIIIEPIAGNMNCIPPVDGFLSGLRQLCDQYNTVLIFDEVMCGFRVGSGSAQALYQVQPDLTTLGKVVGGGMPVGVLGGQTQIMQHLAPVGPVYQAGTLSGNPVAMSAGLAALKLIHQNSGFYDPIYQYTEQLVNGLQQLANQAGIAFTTHHVGSMFGLFFSEEQHITGFKQVTECNIDHFQTFFHQMLKQGVYLAPSAFEAGFTSSAHNDETLNLTLEAAKEAFKHL